MWSVLNGTDHVVRAATAILLRARGERDGITTNILIVSFGIELIATRSRFLDSIVIATS